MSDAIAIAQIAVAFVVVLLIVGARHAIATDSWLKRRVVLMLALAAFVIVVSVATLIVR